MTEYCFFSLYIYIYILKIELMLSSWVNFSILYSFHQVSLSLYLSISTHTHTHTYIYTYFCVYFYVCVCLCVLCKRWLFCWLFWKSFCKQMLRTYLKNPASRGPEIHQSGCESGLNRPYVNLLLLSLNRYWTGVYRGRQDSACQW